jgi:hypothetical protein
MAEVHRVMDQVKRQCHQAQIIMGAAIDVALDDKLCVTVIAARRELPATSVKPRAEPHPENLAAVTREVAAARASRAKRGIGNKPIQTQLPLTIVSKGRFDKSEPTKHNGEDLDIPTFIRRGILLN